MVASVRLYGEPVGLLRAERNGNLEFSYLPEWLERARMRDARAHAISARLPLQSEAFQEKDAGPFFDNLLPDNRQVRETLANYFKVDVSDEYGLLTALGRECPGAVSIMPVDAEVTEDGYFPPTYDILDDARLAQHMRDLPTRPLFVDADGELRLSLPGVHHKAAVLLMDGNVALPRGATPTSHIIKVDIEGLPDSIRVENFCLKLAASVGIDVPKSAVRMAEDISYMLIARYDRVLFERDGVRNLRRLHQEDFCQALGRYPREKYEKDGGPGWAECFNLMTLTADPVRSKEALLSRAVFQFLVNNPDAHAKNYSLVYRSGQIGLSRLYDVNNAAAFRDKFKETRPRLAMFVGGERDPEKLTKEHWDAFAAEIKIRPEPVRSELLRMATTMPAEAAALREKFRETAGDSRLLDIALQDIVARCARVTAWFSRRSLPKQGRTEAAEVPGPKA